MTLTEQWKKGELDRGIYYIKEQGSYKTDEWHGDCWEDSWSENVEEVLAPVPSYEEWQELKELLNFIRDEIADMPACSYQWGFRWVHEAAYRIDNAIGEKK